MRWAYLVPWERRTLRSLARSFYLVLCRYLCWPILCSYCRESWGRGIYRGRDTTLIYCSASLPFGHEHRPEGAL